jgi:hypothetical protein
MDYVVRPNIAAPAAKAASAQQTAQDRLMTYIPLSISGVYPLLENGIAEYVKSPFEKMSPRLIEWAIFGLLLLWYILFLHKQYNKQAYVKWARAKLQGVQTFVSIVAFVVWTYSIKSAIWADVYNAGLAIVFTAIFVLFASLYAPTVTPDQASGG